MIGRRGKKYMLRTRPAGLLVVLGTVLAGCASRAARPGESPSALLIVVAGAGGDGAWRSSLVDGLRRGGVDSDVRIFAWGAPAPLFMLNLQNDPIHRKAERALAEQVRRAAHGSPLRPIYVVGHSAGCGVTLGALSLLDGETVAEVVLLAPSVSPTYDLAPALRHARQVHVFHSTRDTFWLSWRTGTFGTYDNVKTKAAGNVGFAHTDSLPPDLAAKVAQHAYDPAWKALGNDGGHFGPTAKRFSEKVLAPLLTAAQ
jgi:hypothetical protein